MYLNLTYVKPLQKGWWKNSKMVFQKFSRKIKKWTKNWILWVQTLLRKCKEWKINFQPNINKLTKFYVYFIYITCVFVVFKNLMIFFLLNLLFFAAALPKVTVRKVDLRFRLIPLLTQPLENFIEKLKRYLHLIRLVK